MRAFIETPGGGGGGGSGLTWFTSAWQTITAAGTLTLAHGLGASPQIIVPEIICRTANLGYAVGEIVMVNPSAHGIAWTRALSLRYDATNVYVVFGAAAASLQIGDTSGNQNPITNASWEFRVRAAT